ncbi:MAG TPA: hypothetical protein VGE40_07895 [Bacilli bacterium]
MINMIGYSVVVGAAVCFLFLLYYLVKATTDDSDKYNYLKDIVEIVFANQKSPEGQDAKVNSATVLGVEPFEEECPACEAPVTQNDRNCPVCGLKLMD